MHVDEYLPCQGQDASARSVDATRGVVKVPKSWKFETFRNQFWKMGRVDTWGPVHWEFGFGL